MYNICINFYPVPELGGGLNWNGLIPKFQKIQFQIFKKLFIYNLKGSYTRNMQFSTYVDTVNGTVVSAS